MNSPIIPSAPPRRVQYVNRTDLAMVAERLSCLPMWLMDREGKAIAGRPAPPEVMETIVRSVLSLHTGCQVEVSDTDHPMGRFLRSL